MILPVGGSASSSALPTVKVYTIEAIIGPVTPPQGLIYRTRPHTAVVRGARVAGNKCIVKSSDMECVAAELAGSALADLVGLPVPPWGISFHSSFPHPVFCSEQQLRLQALEALNAGRVNNPRIIADTLVFDMWVANDDRNIGGFVCRIPADGDESKVDLLAIDFESSMILRGESPFSVNDKPSKAFLAPREVRNYIPDNKIFEPMCGRIESVTETDLKRAFARLHLPSEGFFQPFVRAKEDSAIKQLLTRGSMIRKLLQEAIGGK